MRISDWSSDVCSSDLASEVNPADFQVPLFLAQTYSSLGRKREEMKVRLGALGTIERHLKLNPHDTRALYFGAQNLVRVGDTAKAIELAERALRQDQNEPIVLYNIACFRSEEHTSELQSLMRISYAVFCLHKKKTIIR